MLKKLLSYSSKPKSELKPMGIRTIENHDTDRTYGPWKEELKTKLGTDFEKYYKIGTLISYPSCK